jgi:hypothetical protein
VDTAERAFEERAIPKEDNRLFLAVSEINDKS